MLGWRRFALEVERDGARGLEFLSDWIHSDTGGERISLAEESTE